MSFCQWADGYHKGKSVGWWCMEGKKHTQESERVLEKIPVVHLIFKVFRLIFLLNMLGFSVCPASLQEAPFSSPQAIRIGRTPPPLTRFKDVTLALPNRSWPGLSPDLLGKKFSSSAVMVRWVGCKPGAPEDHPCHLTGTLCLRMMPTQKRAEPRDKARTSGWHLRTWIQHYLKLPFFFPVTEADKVHFFFFNVSVNWVPISYV